MQPLAQVLGGWPSGGRPLYRALAGSLREAVERGDLTAGLRLPPERSLSSALGVSRATVVAAYELLKDEGLLRGRQGSGTYIAGEPLTGRPDAGEQVHANALFSSLISDSRPTVDLVPGAMPPAPAVRAAIAERLPAAADRVMRTHGYFSQGLPELREAIATRISQQGLTTSIGQVLVTTGAQQAVGLVAELLLEPGDAVAVENPTYPGSLDALRCAGARLLPVPVEPDGIGLDRLEAVLARSRPALVYVIPTHSNPTGAVMTPARRRRLAEIAAATQVPVIEDTVLADLDLVGAGRPPDVGSYDAEAPVVIVGSASKLFWGGFRVGWIRAPERLIERLTPLKTVADLGSPVISQAVVADLLGAASELLDVQRRELRTRRDALTRALASLVPEWRWSTPRGGLSLWVELPRGDGASFAQVARRFGVGVLPGSQLSVTDEHRARLRLSYVASPAELEEAAHRLARAWDVYSPQPGPVASATRVVV